MQLRPKQRLGNKIKQFAKQRGLDEESDEELIQIEIRRKQFNSSPFMSRHIDSVHSQHKRNVDFDSTQLEPKPRNLSHKKPELSLKSSKRNSNLLLERMPHRFDCRRETF